ncbi:hypothetical protein ACSHWB_05135 [Lentzea sp. HUAS TT2]|uniref:hypothetical protein n=1 Tax=Lentzea sp. HUAS TT2 TaxID=3447454 RepID=UPI003F729D2E
MSAVVTASAAILGVLVGAGLQFFQARRIHLWQQQTADRTELRTAGADYLTATLQLAQFLTRAGKQRSSSGAEPDAGEIHDLVRLATEARTQLDLVGGEAVFAATKRYHWELVDIAAAVEKGQPTADTDIGVMTADLRRALMNQIREDLGRPPVLRRWPDRGEKALQN